MPIYEYRCDSCGHTLDALQKISDAPLTDCPECDTKALRRLVSAPAFRLKGGGWYETDFKSDQERKRNLAEGAKEAASDAKSDKTDKSDKSAKTDKTDKTDKKTETKSDQAKKSESAKSKAKGTGSEAA